MNTIRTLSARTARAICTLLILTFVPMSSIQAAMVGTDTVIQAEQVQLDRAQILDRLQSEDAKQALSTLGVDAAQIEDRVASMTNAELAEFNAQLNELPAGGLGIFGIIFFVLLVMIVLDLLGTVDFFPAIKTINY